MADNSIRTRLDGLKLKYEEIGQKLTDPEVIADVKQFIQFNKEYRELEPIIEASERYRTAIANLAEAKDILANDKDEEMREMARGEIAELERDRRDPRRHGRRRSRHLRRRPDAHVHQIHRIQRLEVRNHLLLGRHGRRIQGGRDESHGQQCLWYAQIRIGRTSRAARTPDRNAGPRPHLGRFGGRAARSRGVRRRNLDERRSA